MLRNATDAELLTEGDDGLHFFTKGFIESTLGLTLRQFAKRWCEMYREFGFKIEPQVAEGECAHSDAFQECEGGSEFCSKVFVSIGKGGAYYPKPLKTLTSSQTSFNIRARREDAAATKYLTLCINTVRAPLLHAYMKTTLYYWLGKGAEINPDLLTEHEKSGLEADIAEGATSEEVVERILQECESIQFQMHALFFNIPKPYELW